MEEAQTQDQIAKEGPMPVSSFSPTVRSQSSGTKWLVIFIILLVLGGAGVFFFTKSSSMPIATPTPSFGVVPIEDNAEIEPTQTPTSSPAAVDKEDVSIEVQNGTGITGEAAFLQGKLKTLGYSDIKVGNAPTTDNTETTVTFSKSLSSTVQAEIKKELESIYKTVNVKTSSTQTTDVVIVTGLRGSQTAKPTTSSTSSPKPTSTSSASPTASPN